MCHMGEGAHGGQRKVQDSPGPGITDGCETHNVMLGTDSGPVQE